MIYEFVDLVDAGRIAGLVMDTGVAIGKERFEEGTRRYKVDHVKAAIGAEADRYVYVGPSTVGIELTLERHRRGYFGRGASWSTPVERRGSELGSKFILRVPFLERFDLLEGGSMWVDKVIGLDGQPKDGFNRQVRQLALHTYSYQYRDSGQVFLESAFVPSNAWLPDEVQKILYKTFRDQGITMRRLEVM